MNILRLAILLIAITLILHLITHQTHAGYFLEVGIGKNGLAQDYWEGRDSTGAFFAAGYIHRIDMNQQIIGQWSHESQWTRGDGFDDRDETTNDSISVRYRYEWR